VAHAHEREVRFAATFFGDKPFLYTPATFKLPPGSDRATYTPDFYDVTRDVWIEVVGSRQAYFSSKGSYKSFHAMYPNLKFEIRAFTGEIYTKQNEDVTPQEISQHSEQSCDTPPDRPKAGTIAVQKRPRPR
jgi:hypothetical protein